MNIRPATKDDVEFLKTMQYEAARWNPDWPREPMEEVLDEPILREDERLVGAEELVQHRAEQRAPPRLCAAHAQQQHASVRLHLLCTVHAERAEQSLRILRRERCVEGRGGRLERQ